MENLILLTTTPEYNYYCVPVPKDARSFKVMDGRTTYSVNLVFESNEICYIKIGEREIYYSEIEILGELSEISEEQAREIVESGHNWKDSHPWLNQENKKPIYKNYGKGYKPDWFDTALESLTSLIESKGVSITENKLIIIKVKS